MTRALRVRLLLRLHLHLRLRRLVVAALSRARLVALVVPVAIALAASLAHTARADEGPRQGEGQADQAAASAKAADRDAGLRTHFSVMAGLTQWIVFRGGNVALEYRVGRLAFEVSHGQGLDLNQAGGFALTSAERDAGLRVLVPWTTGFGVGYRITENLHALVELKAHRYDVRTSADEARYTTFSVGPSVFYTFYLYEGLFLQPNVRFWPNVGSTLHDGRALLRNGDGSTYVHDAHDFGLFANVNLGWSF